MALFKRSHREDTEFMSDVSAVTMESMHRGGHILLLLIVLFFSCAVVWAYLTEVDEVTRGEGKVVPSSRLQVIQNLEGGIVSEIIVHEGQLVERGEALMKIDDTRFASSFRETQLKYWELMARAARLEAESNGTALVLPEKLLFEQPVLAAEEQSLFASRQRELESTIQVLNQQAAQRRQELVERQARQEQLQRSYELSFQELTMSEPLVAQGVMSEVELLRLRRTTNELKGEMDANRLAIPRVQSSLNEVRQKITEANARFQTEAARELSEVNGEFARARETISSLQDRVTRTEVRSPVKGTVQRILVNTVGGVVQPGADLVEIVPLEDNLLIEAQIRPADIAFLRPGQNAMIKFTAYDFSIYGGLSATLERISADTVTNDKDESFYLIYLRTNESAIEHNKGQFTIIPGMTVTVDILTGTKTVMDYLLKPLLKAKNEALRER